MITIHTCLSVYTVDFVKTGGYHDSSEKKDEPCFGLSHLDEITNDWKLIETSDHFLEVKFYDSRIVMDWYKQDLMENRIGTVYFMLLLFYQTSHS